MRLHGDSKLRGILLVPAYPVILQLACNAATTLKISEFLESLWSAGQLYVDGLVVE